MGSTIEKQSQASLLLMVVKSSTAGLLVNNSLSIGDEACEKTEKNLQEFSNSEMLSSVATCLSYVPVLT